MPLFDILLVAASAFSAQELTAWFVAAASGISLLAVAVAKLVAVVKQIVPLVERLREKLGLDNDDDDGLHQMVKQLVSQQERVLRQLAEHSQRLDDLEAPNSSTPTPPLRAISTGRRQK